jgi:hypothetical protein
MPFNVFTLIISFFFPVRMAKSRWKSGFGHQPPCVDWALCRLKDGIAPLFFIAFISSVFMVFIVFMFVCLLFCFFAFRVRHVEGGRRPVPKGPSGQRARNTPTPAAMQPGERPLFQRAFILHAFALQTAREGGLLPAQKRLMFTSATINNREYNQITCKPIKLSKGNCDPTTRMMLASCG